MTDTEDDPPKPLTHKQEIGARLREARKAAHFTQAELGRRVSRAQTVIAQYESGVSMPDVPMLAAIAIATDTSPAWLAFGIEAPNDRHADPTNIIGGHKNDPFFAYTFVQAIKMFSDEGLQPDLSYLVAYAARVAEKAQRTNRDGRINQAIDVAIDTERLEIRKELQSILRRRI